MIRLLSALLICVALVAIATLALQQGLLPHADFTYAIGGSIETLDPARMSWHYDNQMALGLWEGLAAYHPQTVQPIPGVAYLPPDISPDATVYTFTLRPDARWSNGDPVTAHDFVFAWRRAIEPGTAKDYAALLTDNIVGAQQYTDFRNNAVRTLTLLRDLHRQRTLEPEDAAFLQALNLPRLNDPQPDYPAIADTFRQNHLAAMDARFAHVGIKALDDHHLRVTLIRPTAFFLELAAWSTFLPIHRSVEMMRVIDDPTVSELTLVVYDPHWVKPYPQRNGYPGLISNGPFRLKDWQFKRHMLFEKNPHYWDRDNVPSQSIMARIIPSPNTAFIAYEQGEIDWLDDLTRVDFAPSLVQQARSGQRPDIHVTPTFGTYFYNFNCKDTLPDGSKNPFADRRVRLAFALAIDKQAIVDKVTKIGAPVANTLVPPESIPNYFCPPAPCNQPDRARQLLADAGYPDCKGLPTIEILYNTGYKHEEPAQVIAEMWRQQLNATVTLRGKEAKTFADDRKNQRFTIARGSWFGDYSDPTTFLDLAVTGNGNNDSAFSNPDYDRLITQAANTLDPQKRLDTLAQAEKLLMHDHIPILPLYYYVTIMAYQPNVQGIFPNIRHMHALKPIHAD